VIFRHLEVTDAAVIAVAEPQAEVRMIRSHVANMLADVGVPSFQPSIIHATVLRYGSSEPRAEALAEAARRVHIESSVPVRQLVLSKETLYPSLVREVIECMPLRGDSSHISPPSTFP
jgi:2'-5' RNA ligase